MGGMKLIYFINFAVPGIEAAILDEMGSGREDTFSHIFGATEGFGSTQPVHNGRHETSCLRPHSRTLMTDACFHFQLDERYIILIFYCTGH